MTSRRRHLGSLQHWELPRGCGNWSRCQRSTAVWGGRRKSTLSAFDASGEALDIAVALSLFFSGVEWMGSVDAVFGIFVEWKVATAFKQVIVSVDPSLFRPVPPTHASSTTRGAAGGGGDQVGNVP